jgi:hypothetical protein
MIRGAGAFSIARAIASASARAPAQSPVTRYFERRTRYAAPLCHLESGIVESLHKARVHRNRQRPRANVNRDLILLGSIRG